MTVTLLTPNLAVPDSRCRPRSQVRSLRLCGPASETLVAMRNAGKPLRNLYEGIEGKRSGSPPPTRLQEPIVDSDGKRLRSAKRRARRVLPCFTSSSSRSATGSGTRMQPGPCLGRPRAIRGIESQDGAASSLSDFLRASRTDAERHARTVAVGVSAFKRRVPLQRDVRAEHDPNARPGRRLRDCRLWRRDACRGARRPFGIVHRRAQANRAWPGFEVRSATPVSAPFWRGRSEGRMGPHRERDSGESVEGLPNRAEPSLLSHRMRRGRGQGSRGRRRRGRADSEPHADASLRCRRGRVAELVRILTPERAVRPEDATRDVPERSAFRLSCLRFLPDLTLH